MTGSPSGAAAEWRTHWRTVLVACLGMSIPGIYLYSLGALIGAIAAETHWTRAGIGAGITVCTAVGAVLSPFMGALVDRFGPRRLALPGIVTYGLAIAALATTGPSLWNWLALWLLVGLAGFGIKPGVWTTAVAMVFRKGRGFALAVALSGTALGTLTVPLLTTWFLEAFGWRMAYALLGAIWAAVCFPVAWWGLHRTGAPRTATGAGAGIAGEDHHAGSLPVRAALLSRQFWLLATAMFVFTLSSMAFTFSAIPILREDGFAPHAAAAIASLQGFTAIAGRLLTGHLLDRTNPRLITVAAMSLPLVTVAMLLGLPGSPVASAIALLAMGLAFGAELDAVAFLTGHYFGTRNYGLLFGSMMAGSTAATSLAPLLAGRIYDVTGSYDLLLTLMVPLSLTAAAAIALLRPIAPAPVDAPPMPAAFGSVANP